MRLCEANFLFNPLLYCNETDNENEKLISHFFSDELYFLLCNKLILDRLSATRWKTTQGNRKQEAKSQENALRGFQISVETLFYFFLTELYLPKYHILSFSETFLCLISYENVHH